MITCNRHPSDQLDGWSLSGNGSIADAIAVNTSLQKYTVENTNTLLVNNISEMDEGLYRCVYRGVPDPHTCVYIYGECDKV